MSKRISFKVTGQVQGVSYRAFTRRKATSYGLTGWVRNMANGQVEGEMQGDEEAIKKLLKDLDNGPPHAHVVKLEKHEEEVRDGESSFEVT
ncbi:MAG: hypothetical protein M1832_002366 [Thelocarpon impressellum]|nr:MAG: hypothetical protein M1832_002366 [Thelocarpon impressellum]